MGNMPRIVTADGDQVPVAKVQHALKPFQEEYMPALRWLFFGPRASGRTTTLAWMFIREALETGHPVVVWDHAERECGFAAKNRAIIPTILSILEDNKDLFTYGFHRLDNSIEVRFRS